MGSNPHTSPDDGLEPVPAPPVRRKRGPDLQAAGRELAHRSRAAQGLPPTVEDPALLARGAELLAEELQADAVRIEAVAPAPLRRRDHDAA